MATKPTKSGKKKLKLKTMKAERTPAEEKALRIKLRAQRDEARAMLEARDKIVKVLDARVAELEQRLGDYHLVVSSQQFTIFSLAKAATELGLVDRGDGTWENPYKDELDGDLQALQAQGFDVSGGQFKIVGDVIVDGPVTANPGGDYSDGEASDSLVAAVGAAMHGAGLIGADGSVIDAVGDDTEIDDDEEGDLPGAVTPADYED